MGILSKVGSAIKKGYTKIDSKIGGILPGGAPRSSGGSSSSGSSSSGSSSGSSNSGSSSNKSSGGGSIISKIGGAVSSTYNKIDTKLGGYLPGGSTPNEIQQAKQSKTLVSQQTSNQSLGFSSKNNSSSFLNQSNKGSTLTDLINKSQSSNNNVSSNQTQSQTQSTFAKQIEELKSQPLGTPDVKDERPWYKKGVGYVSDVISGQTGGVWLSHFGRETGMSAPEIKKEFKESTTKGIKDTIVVGIPGLVGFTGEGKLKTAWSKDKETQAKATFGISPLGNVQAEWTESAVKIRESGETTKQKQKEQIKNIQGATKEIEDLTKSYSGDFTSKDYVDIALGQKDFKLSTQDQIDLMFGKKTTRDFDETKKQAPGIQSKEFEKEADTYLKEVESFNTKYGGKELAPDVYEVAVKEKAKLDAEKERLTIKQDYLTKEYENYQKNIVSRLGDLRKSGVETTIDEKGNIAFTSKELDTKVAPVGFKLQKDFMKDGKLTWKNIAYGGGAVALTTAEAVGVGFLTGGTGVLAKVGAGVSKLPKVAQIGIKGGAVVLAGAGIVSKGYSGYKLAEQVEIPKWYGATLGTTIAVGQLGGFVAGGYYGTKVYYAGVQDKILAGKYTKSVAEMREGTIIVDKSGTAKGGLAKQVGIYETKVKGTEWTIKSGVKMQGTYGKNFGQSNVKIVSEFTGKTPKGMPKSWATEGKTLESGDWVRLRAYTKSSKAKLWYEQDFLMKRTTFDRLKVDVSKSPGFKGYTELERIKFATSIKNVGAPKKVGKVLPEQVWKEDEIFRFTQWKGKGKVVQPWEWGEAKSDSILGTKQYVLYKETKPLSRTIKTPSGNIKVSSTEIGAKQFQSIAQTRGMSTELLKQQLKDAVIIIKESNIGAPMGKRGQVSLTWTKPQVTTQIPKVTTKPALMTKPTTAIDSKALLKIQLQKIVPGLISKQFIAQIPTTLALSSGIIGTKQLIETKQNLAVLNEQVLMQRLRNVQLSKVNQQQVSLQQTKEIQQVQQAQVQALALETAVISPTMTSPPIVATGIPIIPGFPMPDLEGWGWRERKETLGGKRSATYIEDFTSKALGLKPKTLNKAQLKKLLQTDLTGLGIRRGVIPK